MNTVLLLAFAISGHLVDVSSADVSLVFAAAHRASRAEPLRTATCSAFLTFLLPPGVHLRRFLCLDLRVALSRRCLRERLLRCLFTALPYLSFNL